MTHILLVFAIVAGAGTSYRGFWASEWKPLGEFTSAQSCEAARQALGQPDKMRCVAK